MTAKELLIELIRQQPDNANVASILRFLQAWQEENYVAVEDRAVAVAREIGVSDPRYAGERFVYYLIAFLIPYAILTTIVICVLL